MIVLILTLFLSICTLVLFVIGFFNFIVEPVYFYVFKKPAYVYFYPVLKKLSPELHEILRSEIPFYSKLATKKQQYFEHRVVEFLSTYQFHGKESLEITPYMRVKIASVYVMITFGMREYLTQTIDKIIIYPSSYYSTINDTFHNGEFNPRYKAVLFSWQHFMEGNELESDNLNLGIHEFAHVLHYNGMKKRNNSAAFFAQCYNQIRKDVKHPPNAKLLLDSGYFREYAFTNDFEFLAVIMEHFFETPDTFKQKFPELFRKVKQMINYTPPGSIYST